VRVGGGGGRWYVGAAAARIAIGPRWRRLTTSCRCTPAICGKKSVSDTSSRTWLLPPRSIPLRRVGRRDPVAVNGLQMWVEALTWRETCPRPRVGEHVRDVLTPRHGACSNS